MPNQIVPAGYEQLLRELKNRIRSAQVKAALAVNREYDKIDIAIA
jgi:hypothetical protein